MAPTTIATENTCTTITVDDAELRMYMSTQLQKLADLVTTKCVGCDAPAPAAYARICDTHFIGSCCLTKKSKHFKICSDRRGDHKMCPAAGCRNTPRDKPSIDHQFTAVVRSGREVVDDNARHIGVDQRSTLRAEILEEARVNMLAKAPSRKRKVDCAPGEWDAIQTTKKERKVAKERVDAFHLDNAFMAPRQKAFMIQAMGSQAAYDAWEAAERAPAVEPAPEPVTDDEPIDSDCMECDEE